LRVYLSPPPAGGGSPPLRAVVALLYLYLPQERVALAADLAQELVGRASTREEDVDCAHAQSLAPRRFRWTTNPPVGVTGVRPELPRFGSMKGFLSSGSLHEAGWQCLRASVKWSGLCLATVRHRLGTGLTALSERD